MTHSGDTSKVAEAIGLVQDAVRPVKCNAVGSDGKPYADLAAVRRALKKPLADHNLTVVQSGAVNSVETVILHSSNQWISLIATTERNESGEWAYGARHALMLAFGVTTQLPKSSVALGTLSAAGVWQTACGLMDAHGLNAAQQIVLLRKHQNYAALKAEVEGVIQ